MGYIRNLKTFVKHGKRYRVVHTAPSKNQVDAARKMYDNKITAIHYDSRKNTWLIGVR